MKLIQQIKAGRHIDKLRQSRSLPDEEVKSSQDELVALGPAGIPLLIGCLGHGEARGPAMTVLQQLVTADTLPVLVEALASPNSAQVSGVTQVLEKSEGFDPLLLLHFLGDPQVPKAALDSILSAHSSSIHQLSLIDMLPKLGKESRAIVFRLLEKVADSNSVQRIIRLLSHEDWSMRMHAVRLLGRFPEPPVIEAISALLRDENKTVRLEAVKALQTAGSSQAVPALAQALRDTDLKVQTAGIDALLSLGDASAVTHLLEVLQDESEYTRRAAVEVLNHVATTEAIQDLVRALRDADWWVRVRAADALGALGGERVVDAVVGLLGDQDDFIRRYAVEILNSVPSQRSVGPLTAALDDPDWWVRERSIDALGKTKDPRAVEPLIALIQREGALATLGTQALCEIGDRRALEGLCGLMDAERKEIRQAASEALRSFPSAGLSPEDRIQLSEALARAGLKADPGTPMRVGGQRSRSRSGLGPETGRSISTPMPYAATPHPTASTPPPHGAPPAQDPASGGFPAPNFSELPPDTVLLNRFRVLRTIGKGGFGVVYLVHDAAIQDNIILKVLNPQLSMDEGAIQRFVRELKLTRKITHKNVIRIHDLLDLGGVRAVSMEYFPGRDLGKIIKLEEQVEIRRALLIMANVCEGLAAAHIAGVIHRDVKPANILVGEGDAVKIVDFGLASARQQFESRLTKSGLLVGTPEYMAPEQIRGNVIDPRTDLYSVGILMYETLAGEKPFTGETAVQILFQHLEGKAQPLSRHRKDLAPGLEALVERAMAREPDQRHQSAEELLAEIQAVLATLDPGPEPGHA
jgi:serine/threonine-protein kinase